MKYMDLKGHTQGLYMIVDMDKIIKIFMKNSHTKYL